MALSVILVRPVVAGNVGAVARLMGNFDVERLVLVQPECDHLSKEAVDRAKHNKSVLKNAVIVDSIEKAGCEWLVATTSLVGLDFNLLRSPLSPNDAAKAIPQKGNIGLVFGPEGPGLSNKELLQCDFTLTIPTSKKYHSMNVSHAVAIILYELHVARAHEHVASHIRPINDASKKQLLKMIDETIDSLDFRSELRRDTQHKIWKKIVGKSFLTQREAMALMGFFRQALRKTP